MRVKLIGIFLVNLFFTTVYSMSFNVIIFQYFLVYNYLYLLYLFDLSN